MFVSIYKIDTRQDLQYVIYSLYTLNSIKSCWSLLVLIGLFSNYLIGFFSFLLL